jgi:hypothetical protein
MADVVPDLDALAGDPTFARHTHLDPTSPKNARATAISGNRALSRF